MVQVINALSIMCEHYESCLVLSGWLIIFYHHLKHGEVIFILLPLKLNNLMKEFSFIISFLAKMQETNIQFAERDLLLLKIPEAECYRRYSRSHSRYGCEDGCKFDKCHKLQNAIIATIATIKTVIWYILYKCWKLWDASYSELWIWLIELRYTLW